jgi:hypothetical protein
MINLELKTITKKEAIKLNMEIWNGNESNIQYARMQHGKDRDTPLYGYVFTIV